ncbi:MAG TPA: hypothetical protein PKA90_09275 [Ignavibacteria bacterium]|nr:hypothetical protein [Ignavibacteria bacterium]HMR40607.1 hypothetical protein [Ignavibacteria bacterium]
MNWKIILYLTLASIVIGIASVFGIFNSNFMPLVMLIFSVISGYIIAKKSNSQLFMNGVMVGLFSGIVISVIQAVMFDTYLLNNKDSLDGFTSITGAMPTTSVIIFLGPFIGLVYGIIAGLVAGKIYKSNKK